MDFGKPGAVLFGLLLLVLAASLVQACELMVRIESGRICGSKRIDEAGRPYASFRGVPYAKQPLGELRFKELQPAEPFEGILNATTDGPACPQKNVLFAKLKKSLNFSESCILVNVHVPIEALPDKKKCRVNKQGLPILVVIYGGAFHFGSGDSDFYGPEYLVSKDVIVITFNYRINVFGFLSLDTAEIPGNQALRDVVTLLRWVQRNARAFGGDPSDVTLFGFSSGAATAHLVTLSAVAEAESLFKRTVISSGAGFPGFHTESKVFAKKVVDTVVPSLGINSTDPAEIHRQLCAMPIEQIMNATWFADVGLVYFMPVVESSFPGVTRMIDDVPEVLLSQGRGNDKPLIIGFGNNESYSFTTDIENLALVPALAQNHTLLTPPNLMFSPTANNNEIQQAVQRIMDEYFSDGNVTLETFLPYLSDNFFKYPAIKSALLRAQAGGAPVFLYQFSYNANHSLIKEGLDLDFDGAGHFEDITNYFKMNSRIPSDAPRSFPPQNRDDEMRDWMTGILTNFMRCSNPTCEGDHAAEWPAVDATSVEALRYQDISEPKVYRHLGVNPQFTKLVKFFDSLQPNN